MFESVAVWADVGHGRFITKDKHHSKEQAEAVCDLLEQNGFGGEGLVFPELTVVRKVKPTGSHLTELEKKMGFDGK